MTYLDTVDPAKLETALARFATEHSDKIAKVNGDKRFALWLYLIETRMLRLIGISYQDLPDYAFRDAYDGGVTPSQVARDLLEENGYV